jgi:hypothetical protein
MSGKKVNQETTATMNGSNRQTPNRPTVVPGDMTTPTTTAKNSRDEDLRTKILRNIDACLDISGDGVLDSLSKEQTQ